MRIRKHAKTSPLNLTPNPSSAASAAVPLTCVCQLNQSPWDAMTFSPEDDNDDPARLPPSPPPFLVDREYYRCSYLSNRTFGNHIDVRESTPKMEKRDDAIPVAAAVAVVGKVNNKHHRDKEENERSIIEKEGEEVILCTKPDKKGWQCGERVKTGHSFCNKHLLKGKSNSKNYSAAAHSKKSMPSKEQGRRAPRSRKPASSPYEFYYYSGFGPRWGKRRGESYNSTVSAAMKQEPYASLESGSCSDTSSTSRNPSVITEDAAENGEPKLSSNSNGTDKESVFSQFESHGLDLEDDDDGMEEDFDHDYDDDGEGGEKIGTKRGRSRKPIKARSLKSLM